MMGSTWRAAGAALVVLAQSGDAGAQTVHKCIVNGAVTYQAAACPVASAEKSVIIPPPPSEQELLDATANARLQKFEAATGWAVPPSRRNRKTQPRRLTPSMQEAEAEPQNNCERLNQAYHEASYRRDELQAPGDGATRAAALQRARDDIARTQEQAALTHCQLR